MKRLVKCILGDLTVVGGVFLTLHGIFGLVIGSGLSSAEPDFANWVIELSILAIVIGLLLNCAGWLFLRREIWRALSGAMIGLSVGLFLRQLGPGILCGLSNWTATYLVICVPMAAGAVTATVTAQRGQETNYPSRSSKLPPRERLCPNCGRQIQPGFNTCKWCGANLE